MWVPVWVEAWQQQCCGTEFAVGDEVRWTLVESDDLLRRLLGDGYPRWAPELALDRTTMLRDGDTMWVVRRRGGLTVNVPEADEHPATPRRVALPTEEHHGHAPEGAVRTTGTVRRIRITYCRYVPIDGSSNVFAPAPGSATFKDAPSAVSWPAEDDEHHFSGLLVDLDVADAGVPV